MKHLLDTLQTLKQEVNYLSSFQNCPLSSQNAKVLAAKAAERLSVDILLMEAQIEDLTPVLLQ